MNSHLKQTRQSEGFPGSRLKPSNNHHRLTGAVIDISELVPGNTRRLKSSSCFWQRARGARVGGGGDRHRQDGMSAEHFYVCISSQPHNVWERE